MTPFEITDKLVRALDGLTFTAPVHTVYNPLVYASATHRDYLTKYGVGQRRYVVFGMNPGPWGMAQTGVPFGAVPFVRDWLKIEGEITRPDNEHPKRPVTGLNCTRVEVSGARLWGWVQERFVEPERFFERFMVINYCPLLFLEESARNLTPDKIRKTERDQVISPCDIALREFVDYYQPELVIGVGAFAEKRAKLALKGLGVNVGRILHPSPASPAANRGWAAACEKQLKELGVEF